MKVHLAGHLNYYDMHKRSWLDFENEEKTGLADLICQLGIPMGEVAVALVNGKVADVETTLVSPADVVELYPPIAGGSA